MGHPEHLSHTYALKDICHGALRVGEQVRVSVGYVGGLVPHAVDNGYGGEAHVYDHRDVAAAQVADSDPLNSRICIMTWDFTPTLWWTKENL